MSRRSVILFIVIAALALAAIAIRPHIDLPPHWNPWSPLRLDEPPGLLTRYKLRRASSDPAACRAALAQAQWRYVSIDDEVTRPGCGYSNAVRIERMSASVNEPFVASCREALSVALWERHVLQPAAQQYFRAPVTRIEHFGSYSCRSVYGRANARMSHHATADALDIAGFVIGANTRIRVLRDWDNGGAAGRFLRDVHEGACRYFDSVLGPEYNAAHRDHFHLDRGAFRVCK